MPRLSVLILLLVMSACAAKRPLGADAQLDPSIKPLTVEQEEQTR